MTREEFWEGDPRLVEAYRKAEEIKRENRYIAEWREGIYVKYAVLSALSKETKYPKEPIFSVELEKQQSEEEKQKAKMEQMMKRFEGLADAVNKFRAPKGEE